MSKSLISKFKELVEISYWKFKKFKEGILTNWHYEQFYTSYFDLEKSFYDGKTILDIGCGPRGSLEWADMAIERIGLDPLSNRYLKLGADKHKMKYVNAYSEDMPFGDGYFDVVCSFNSLDHVEDVKQTCHEIRRVLKPEGIFLLIVDVHAYPTPTEPQSLKWDFVAKFFNEFEILKEYHYKITDPGKIYANARKKASLGESKPKVGLLVAKLKKPV